MVDWQQVVFFVTDSRPLRRSAVGTLLLLGVWVIGLDSLMAWQQEQLFERFQPMIDRIGEVGTTTSVPAPAPAS
jgi:hypothetical protein